MKKFKFILAMAFLFILNIVHTQNPLEDEDPLDFGKWNAKNWRPIKDLTLSPLTKKVNVIEGSGAVLIETATSIQSPQSHYTFLLSVETNSETSNQTELYLNSLCKLDIGSLNFGRLTSGSTTFSPETNVRRADGLWQKIELSIDEVPNFSEKLLINYVKINDVSVYQNLFIANPRQKDQKLIFKNIAEKIALRNLKIIEQTNTKPIALKNIFVEVYENFNWDSCTTNNREPLLKKNIDAIHHDVGQNLQRKNYLSKYDGDLVVEKEGVYNFTFDFAGKLAFAIDGQTYRAFDGDVFDRKFFNYKIKLQKGTHRFHLEYIKVWLTPALGMFISGNGAKLYPNHELTSLPHAKSSGKILLNPSKKTESVRGFYMHKGVKNTTSIAVGFPSQINYAMNLDNATLLSVWKGNFTDMQEMWHERGEPQLFKAEGMMVDLSGKATLLNASYEPYQINYRGYQLDLDHTPTYNYSIDNFNVKYELKVQSGGLKNIITISDELGKKIVLGRANKIEKMEHSLYKLDQYYINIEGNLLPEIRKIDNEDALVVPAQNIISFTLIW